MGSSDHLAQKPQIGLVPAAPRGFCAGIERAIRIVELALPDDSTVTLSAHVRDRLAVDQAVRNRGTLRWRAWAM
jgi:4-hydroxy-3-methylbut-2-enyl diphosphate reductase IspH